jgi:hypothetical protein
MELLRALRELRGDDKTFAGESAKLMIPGTGANLIATADREGTNRRYGFRSYSLFFECSYKLQVCTHAGMEQIIDNPEKIVDPTRRALAIEFGILNVSQRARVTAAKRKQRQQTAVCNMVRLP